MSRLARGLDQTANTFAVTDLSEKSEIARGRLDIEWATRSSWLAAVDLESHGLAGRCRCGGDVIRGDFFRMCNEIAELPPIIDFIE